MGTYWLKLKRKDRKQLITPQATPASILSAAHFRRLSLVVALLLCWSHISSSFVFPIFLTAIHVTSAHSSSISSVLDCKRAQSTSTNYPQMTLFKDRYLKYHGLREPTAHSLSVLVGNWQNSLQQAKNRNKARSDRVLCLLEYVSLRNTFETLVLQSGIGGRILAVGRESNLWSCYLRDVHVTRTLMHRLLKNFGILNSARCHSQYPPLKRAIPHSSHEQMMHWALELLTLVKRLQDNKCHACWDSLNWVVQWNSQQRCIPAVA